MIGMMSTSKVSGADGSRSRMAASMVSSAPIRFFTKTVAAGTAGLGCAVYRLDAEARRVPVWAANTPVTAVGRQAVTVELPAGALAAPGDYLINLTAGERNEVRETYLFRVIKAAASQ